MLRVRDSGAGIDPAFLPHVFERFRQETSDVTREHAGLGLGLSLVRHLAELHGGTVTAESARQGAGRDVHGATAAHRRPGQPPAAAQTPAMPRQPTEPLPHILQHLYVLAVDDDADARELVSAVLQRAGAQVTVAMSVREAIAAIGVAAARCRPDRHRDAARDRVRPRAATAGDAGVERDPGHRARPPTPAPKTARRRCRSGSRPISASRSRRARSWRSWRRWGGDNEPHKAYHRVRRGHGGSRDADRADFSSPHSAGVAPRRKAWPRSQAARPLSLNARESARSASALKRNPRDPASRSKRDPLESASRRSVTRVLRLPTATAACDRRGSAPPWTWRRSTSTTAAAA